MILKHFYTKLSNFLHFYVIIIVKKNGKLQSQCMNVKII